MITDSCKIVVGIVVILSTIAVLVRSIHIIVSCMRRDRDIDLEKQTEEEIKEVMRHGDW